MVYIIKKNGKRSSKFVFTTSDEARNYVRRMIRARRKEWRDSIDFVFPHNPGIGDWGYTIERKFVL